MSQKRSQSDSIKKKIVRHSLSLQVKLEVLYLKQFEKGEHYVDIQRVMGRSQLIWLFESGSKKDTNRKSIQSIV